MSSGQEKLEQYGNQSTYNMENVLRQNIINSDYYRTTCITLMSWSDVIDEIYDNVDHVEPWMSGNARGASTAFCLLYRLFTLKLTVKEVTDTLKHGDSPYIRAVGFLYLRYVCDPKNLWSWFAPYVKDTEEFSPSKGAKSIPLGDFVRDILLDMYYFETIFPRIPKKVSDDIIDVLKQRGLPTMAKGNGGQGGADRRGVDDANRRPASVKASLSVAFGQRAPNRAGAREDGRGRDPSLHEKKSRGGDADERTKSRSRTPPPFNRREGVTREESRERRGFRDDREEGRYRSRDKEYPQDGHRQREREREHPRDRDREYRDKRFEGRDRRDFRERSPVRGRDSGRGDRYKYDSRSDRERRRSLDRRETRDVSDVFKDSAVPVAQLDTVKHSYGDAQGRLFDDRSSKRVRAEEVYKLGSWR